MLKEIRVGLADIRRGLSSWRTWWMLAWNDVRRRYRRSGLGQFWLTLSMGATIGGLGYVYSHLFGVDVSTYLPYIAVTFVAWGIISAVIVESCTALSEGDQILRQIPLPRSLFACRVIARNFIVAAHNVLIVPVVFVWFHVGINANILWLIIGLATARRQRLLDRISSFDHMRQISRRAADRRQYHAGCLFRHSCHFSAGTVGTARHRRTEMESICESS